MDLWLKEKICNQKAKTHRFEHYVNKKWKANRPPLLQHLLVVVKDDLLSLLSCNDDNEPATMVNNLPDPDHENTTEKTLNFTKQSPINNKQFKR